MLSGWHAELTQPVPARLSAALATAEEKLSKLNALPPISKSIEKNKAKRKKLQDARREEKKVLQKAMRDVQCEIRRWHDKYVGYTPRAAML